MLDLLVNPINLLHQLGFRVKKLLFLGVEHLLLCVETPSNYLNVLLDGLQISHQKEVLLLEVHEYIHQLGGILKHHILVLVLLLKKLQYLRVCYVVIQVYVRLLLLLLRLARMQQAVQEVFVF